MFTRIPVQIPKHSFPARASILTPRTKIVHDELMLDGNARLNLATFVTTWMDHQPPADDRHVRQEHDRQGRVPAHRGTGIALRADAVRLWHAPDRRTATGCSTTGSSEACMLAGLAMNGAGAAGGRPMANRPTGPTS